MLNPSTNDFIAIFRLEGALEMALTVAALAGLSEAAGESAVLFINRVGYKLPMKTLFKASTVLLVVTAIILLGKGLHALQEVGLRDGRRRRRRR